MKISYKCDYALKALFHLALRYEEGKDGVLSISELAKLGDIPTNFLEQIFLILRKGGFVKSVRGVRGGFFLARAPRAITVGEVIRFIEGPVEPISCIEEDHYKGCRDFASCIFRSVWKEVADAISIVIDTLTFEELVMRYKEKNLEVKSIFNYSI